MNGNPAFAEARRAQACDWIVRLQAADEPTLLAFDAWLDASPENARAYDEALAVWTEYDEAAPQVLEGLQARPARPAANRRLFAVGGALAAAAAAAFVILPQLTTGPTSQTYVTGHGEHRTLKLDDGSTVELNADTRFTVAFRREQRSVALESGQAIFDVAANKARPFVIAAGDREVRVVGTQFDVRRREGHLSVAVARGVVEVRPAAGGQGRGFRLKPGQRLDHREGEVAAQVRATTPEEVLGWRSGRLIYRDRPLSEVVADLNAQFSTPIRIEDPALAATPISGVLIVDDEAAVIRRLALLVSAQPVRSGSGVVLRR